MGKEWNMKYLRAVQRMLIPTQGKGVSSRSFFEADFGKSPQEFVQFLAMPESHLGWRGDFIPRKNETPKELSDRRDIWNDNQLFLKEWERLFEETGETKAEFIDLIGDNNISLERFAEIKNDVHKKLFIHYFTSTMLLKAFLIKDVETRYMYVKYITEEFPLIYQRLVKYIAGGRIPYSVLEGIYLVIGKKLVSDIMREIDFNAADTPYVINNLMKVQNNVKRYTFDFNLVK